MNQSTSRLPDNWVEKLFTKFSLFYGTKFTAMWNGIDAEMVKRQWSESLAGITGEQLSAALQAMETQCPYPPTLPEFKILCKQQKISPMHQRYIPKLHEKDLTEGKKRIAEMREILTSKLKVENGA